MNRPKNRWLAFASHLGLSFLIFLAILLVIIVFLYPGALFSAAGGWQGIRIIIGVDLVIGPLLTLIVYNPTKPNMVLFRDLAVIAAIQLLCLVAGSYIVFAERPMAVTYTFDKFFVLKHRDFVAAGTDPAAIDLNRITPKIFYTDLSNLSETTGVEAEAIINLFSIARKDLSARADLYRQFPKSPHEADKLFGNAKLPQYPGHRAGCVTAELVTAYAKGIVCFDVEAQRFEQFVSLEELQTRQESGN